jgi:hypothetical protein
MARRRASLADMNPHTFLALGLLGLVAFAIGMPLLLLGGGSPRAVLLGLMFVIDGALGVGCLYLYFHYRDST